MRGFVVSVGIIGTLSVLNISSSIIHEKEIKEKDQIISNLHSLNDQYESKINTYQVKANDFKSKINELNYNVKLKDKKITDLQKQLKELKAKQRQKESP